MKRANFITRGEALGADTSEVAGYHDSRAGRESDFNLIRLGPERYKIPDVVIFGS